MIRVLVPTYVCEFCGRQFLDRGSAETHEPLCRADMARWEQLMLANAGADTEEACR